MAAARKERASKNAYRRSDIGRLIMSRVGVRSKSKRSPKFNVAAARGVLEAFGHKSAWSGAGDDLTIVRIDRARPLSPTNAMVLQVRETNRSVPGDVLERAAATVGASKRCPDDVVKREQDRPPHADTEVGANKPRDDGGRREESAEEPAEAARAPLHEPPPSPPRALELELELEQHATALSVENDPALRSGALVLAAG